MAITKPIKKRKFNNKKKRKRICQFCAQQFLPDFKDSMLLRQYISDRGKIHPQRSTGACAKHQRILSTTIKQSRHLGFIPFAVA